MRNFSINGLLVTAAPPTRVFEDVDNVITAGRYINLANLGSASLFGAIVTALLSVEIYRFFIEKDIMIKMPDGVPPEVSNSFIALIPEQLFFYYSGLFAT